MRITPTILAGAMAALVSLATPALAGHPDARNASEPAASSSCSARQRMADGTWTQVPCQEQGPPAPAPRKSATRSPDRQTR